jgi:predicted ATPase
VIHNVSIENFRALRSVRARLRPLNVLVGPNDSGKTSFLEAIDFFANQRNIQREDWWREEEAAQVDLRTKQGHSFDGHVALFKLPSEGIPMCSPGIPDERHRGAPHLQANGSHLGAFLDYLLRKDRKRYDQIQHSLRQLVPGLEEVVISTPSSDSRAVTLVIEKGYEIPGDRLSTGVRMLFFFVALAHHPDPPDVVLIEEPENGVHPKRLKEIVELLRGLSHGELSGHPVQVILSTHSPYLLDHIRLPEDQVLVFTREVDGQRTAQEADDQRLKAFLDEFMLGEVWFNQGEEGLVTSSR